MAFVVEDGSGMSNANSYTSVEFADSYFADRGITSWAQLSLETKQGNLVVATDYIDTRFSSRIRGLRLEEDQALLFPRDIFNGIPIALQKATSEYALRASAGPLAPDPEVDASGYQISERSEKVGPIEETVKFSTGTFAKQTIWRAYPMVDGLLAGFIRPWTTGRVIRG